MNPFDDDDAICSVCGGTGKAHVCDRKLSWLGNFRHSDPEVCAIFLAERARKLTERETALNTQPKLEVQP